MKQLKITEPKKRPIPAGFALIASITIMVLLVLIALAMLNLSVVELRGSKNGLVLGAARANARMALMIAIGELQKAAGPDQRVTAPADILTTTQLQQPRLVGVWKSFTQPNDDTAPIDYDTQKKQESRNGGDFIQWLSSSIQADRLDIGYPTREPSDAAKLVDEGTVAGSSDSVASSKISAPTVELSASTDGTGKYAWHILDQSQKANITLDNVTPTTDAEKVASLGTGGKPGFKIDADYEKLDALSDLEREKLISLDTTKLIDFDATDINAFHYMTPVSKNLFVDVTNGGYQKDLSLLFEGDTLPADYADRHIYSEEDDPVVEAPARDADKYLMPMPSPDPKWSLLHSHYKLYREVENDSGFVIQASDNELFSKGESWDVAENPEKEINPNFSYQQQLQPVISNVQLIFSLAPEEKNQGGEWRQYVRYYIDVVVTLWNPYNVKLEFSDLEIELYRFPIQFQFMRETVNNDGDVIQYDVTPNQKPVHLANMFNLKDELWTSREVPYRMRIQGNDSNTGESIVLKPGEFKVFGEPKNAKKMADLVHYAEGLILTEGHGSEKGFHEYRFLRDNDRAKIGAELDDPTSYGTHRLYANLNDTIKTRISPAKLDSGNEEFEVFPELNNQEPAAYLKFYTGTVGRLHDDNGGTNATPTIQELKRAADANPNRVQIGAIEWDTNDLAAHLPTLEYGDVPFLTFGGEPEIRKFNNTDDPESNDRDNKVPLLIASMRLKTEQDSNTHNSNMSSMWLNNGIMNPYFSNGFSNGSTDDQNVNLKTHQYEVTWEPFTGWESTPTVSIGSGNRGYGGTGVTPQSGVEYAPFSQVPLAPATSLAQFSHAPLNTGGVAPFTTQIVGNSFAAMLVPRNTKIASKDAVPGAIADLIDHSYMANTTLFDGYFLSTAASEQGPLAGSSPRNLDTVLSEFFDGTRPLANPNVMPKSGSAPTITVADYATFADHIYNNGAFNVNSTSVEAWALFLASGTQEALPILDVLTGGDSLTDADDSEDLAVSRFAPMAGDEMPDNLDYNDGARLSSHRRLSAAQIMDLAEQVVTQVKARGPFQSVAEFVNRRLEGSDSLLNSGALQTAIEQANLNDEDFGGVAVPKNHSELNSAGGSGKSSDGSVSQITQADILNRLAPSLTVRGDTYLIRTYGEATIGNQTSRVWCEAVVQRGHEFVDTSQPSTTAPADLNLINQTYGRRFNIVSFRWLSEKEV